MTRRQLPGATTVARYARADGCPEVCGNVEPPAHVEGAPGGFVAHYHCRTCGAVWTTAWRD